MQLYPRLKLQLVPLYCHFANEPSSPSIPVNLDWEVAAGHLRRLFHSIGKRPLPQPPPPPLFIFFLPVSSSRSSAVCNIWESCNGIQRTAIKVCSIVKRIWLPGGKTSTHKKKPLQLPTTGGSREKSANKNLDSENCAVIYIFKRRSIIG